jgi:hypothetical protein
LNRRGFLHALGTGSAAALAPVAGQATIPEHNWEGYDFGAGPPVSDRLYQGPFPQYSADAVVPNSDVVMVTTPSTEIVPNCGMGLVVYVSGDTGPPRLPGETLEKSLEDLVKIPLTQKIYIRPNWRDVQKNPGRLEFPTGGKSPSIWRNGITSGSAFALCWRTRIFHSRECRSS